MIIRALTIAATLLLVVVLAAGRALAGAPEPCAGLGGHLGHWRIAGHDRTHTTSRCAGSAGSPLCALDTYEAGWVREDLALGRRSPPTP
jgi:hypothetical protein